MQKSRIHQSDSLREYEKYYYVRFAVVLKAVGRAIGTVEIFGGEAGVLRIDLAAEYNTEENYTELVNFAKEQFAEDFGVGSIKIKTANIPERVAWLEQLGFVKSKEFRPEFGYHEYDVLNEDVLGWCSLCISHTKIDIIAFTNTSKSNAIRQLQAMLCCEKVIVFGGGKNDIDMFQIADESYAVANAHEELKQYATEVILSNDEDGVAKWLKEHYLLG